MAGYRVEVQSGAERDLGRLTPRLLERLNGAMAALGKQPRPNGAVRLTGVDAFRVRVGDYRVIYEVDDRRHVVYVTRVRHRRDVYRRLR